MDQAHTRFPLPVLVGILAVGAFTTAVNVTLLSPLLPHIAADFSLSDAAAGQLGTLTAIFAALTAIVLTPFIDRYSRRILLQIEAVLLCLATLLSVVAPTFTVLAVSRALAGIGGAIIFGVCLATAGDLFTDPRRRNQAIGIIGTAATLGTILGLPVLTLVADVTSWRWAIAVVVPLTVILFAGAFGLPRRAATPPGTARRSWLGGYRMVFANPTTVALLAMMVTLAATWFAWLLYFGAFAGTVAGVGAGLLAVLFLVGGGAEIIGNNLGPLLLQRFPARPLALITVLVAGLNLVAIGTIPTESWILFPFMVIGSLTSVLLFVFICILQLDSLPEGRGAVMALQSAGFEVGGALGLSGFGLALVLTGAYPAALRLVGVVTLLILAPITYYACRPTPARELDPAPVTP
ncbi:MAG: MFS transporter [Chloroflexia bacterium]|nr:MFS transporter [Chloroflexia bacterium]